MKELAHQKNCTDLEKLKLPPVNPPTFEIFIIPNLEIMLPDHSSRSGPVFLQKHKAKDQELPTKRKIPTAI